MLHDYFTRIALAILILFSPSAFADHESGNSDAAEKTQQAVKAAVESVLNQSVFLERGSQPGTLSDAIFYLQQLNLSKTEYPTLRTYVVDQLSPLLIRPKGQLEYEVAQIIIQNLDNPSELEPLLFDHLFGDSRNYKEADVINILSLLRSIDLQPKTLTELARYASRTTSKSIVFHIASILQEQLKKNSQLQKIEILHDGLIQLRIRLIQMIDERLNRLPKLKAGTESTRQNRLELMKLGTLWTFYSEIEPEVRHERFEKYLSDPNSPLDPNIKTLVVTLQEASDRESNLRQILYDPLGQPGRGLAAIRELVHLPELDVETLSALIHFRNKYASSISLMLNRQLEAKMIEQAAAKIARALPVGVSIHQPSDCINVLILTALRSTQDTPS